MASRNSAKGRFLEAAIARVPSSDPSYEHDIHARTLRIKCIPKGEKYPTTIDCSPLLALPHCAIDFVSVLARCAPGSRRGTSQARIEHLKSGFIRFALKTGQSDLRLCDVDTPLIAGFIAFLSLKNADGSYALSSYTRIHRYGTLKEILLELKSAGKGLPPDCELPSNPWPTATRGDYHIHKGRGTKDQGLSFYQHCRRRVAETMIEVYTLWGEEEDAGSVFGGLISRLKTRFGGALPERRALMRIDRNLFKEVEACGYGRVARAFGPYAADLCPFVYYLLFTTAFNLQPLVDIRAEDVVTVEDLGRKRVSISSVKHRATSPMYPNGKRVRATFTLGDDNLSPAAVLRFLLRWTTYLRENSTSPHRDALFLFLPRNRSDATTLDTYAHEGRRVTNFQRHANAFCRIEDFPWIGARQIRNVVAEIADEMLDGDVLALGDLLQHSRTETTRDHYHNNAVRARQEVHLAYGMQSRQRWFDSKGKIEPRNVPAEHDHSATTRGFRCLDPANSPMLGQEIGRPCSAYGECPWCPLAMVDLNSPYAAACCVDLKVAFEQYRASFGLQAFRVRWERSYRALTEVWIPAFPAEIWARVARMNLPRMPELE